MVLQKQNLYSYKLISVNTLLLQSKSQHTWHDDVSQYLVDMIVHELWYNLCVCD